MRYISGVAFRGGTKRSVVSATPLYRSTIPFVRAAIMIAKKVLTRVSALRCSCQKSEYQDRKYRMGLIT
jgi:hypothetical protein